MTDALCPTCGPVSGRIWLDQGNPSRYVHCDGCGNIFLWPQPTLGTAKPGESGSLENHLSIARARLPAFKFISRVIDERTSGGRMLDIGCSSGDLFQFFTGARWEKHGIEPFRAAAEIAAKNHHAQVLPGTLREASYPAAHFDLVTMMDTLYHIPEPKVELQEISRVLRPQGVVAIEFAGDSYSRLRNRGFVCEWIDGEWTRLRTDGHHLYWYSTRGLERLLRQSGFEVTERFPVPSPVRKGYNGLIASAYNRTMGALTSIWPGFLSWAPKYLWLIRKLGS